MKSLRLSLAAIVFAIAGCASGPLAVEPPQNFTEKLAYTETGAQAAIKTLMNLTCQKYHPANSPNAGQCTDVARPLHPERSKGYLEQISRVRTAIRAAGTMSAAGGQCLGQPS